MLDMRPVSLGRPVLMSLIKSLSWNRGRDTSVEPNVDPNVAAGARR